MSLYPYDNALVSRNATVTYTVPVGSIRVRVMEGATINVFGEDATVKTAPFGARTEVAPPLVSIGMPVFNGADYVDAAIESILAQSFTDFELIICDNASTDATAEICRAHAARDARIRYVRNPRNLGAGPNFDMSFHLARGTYFLWAAHDDMRAPAFLARAVAALERNPEAVLCVAGVAEIDAEGAVVRRYATGLDDTTLPDPARRFACVIHAHHQCEDFFGLYRRSALLGSGLIGSFTGSDRVVLAEAALRGPWVRLPEHLFLHRDHAARATRALLLVDPAAAGRWVTQGATPRLGRMFHLVLYRNYWRAVRRIVPPGRRWRCYRELLRWWFTDGHFADVLRDALQSIDPNLLCLVRSLKRAILGQRRDLRPGSLPTLER